MISFRYHIVSIVAVFLALALGIVVGTTALNGPITKDLRNQVNDVKSQRDDLSQQVKTLRGQVDDAGVFASTYSSQLVAGRLKDQSIIVVSLPGTTPGMQDGIGEQIAAAGGKIAGRLTITKDYLDPGRADGISSLATGPSHPATITLPETNDAGKLGGALLAYVLLGKGQKTDLKQVISGFSELHMVSVDGGDINPSTSVIVLGRGKLDASSYASRGQLSLVDALISGGGKVVVAGDNTASEGGGIVAAVRDAAKDRDACSSVDDVNTAFGQVSATLALAATINGQTGHYGSQKGADSLFPTPSK